MFLDYRIPLFECLNTLFCGEFTVMYSPRRYANRFKDVLAKIDSRIPHIVNEFNGEYVFNTHTMSFNKSSYKGRNLVFTYGLFRKLINLSPDIVITEGFLGWTPIILLYCTIFRKKLVVHYERTCHTERNTHWFITLQRKIYNRFIDAYLVNGTETNNYLKSIGIKEEKMHLAGMSADTRIKELVNSLSQNDISKLEKKYDKNKKGLLYLYVGRTSIAKGVDRLLNAWQKHIKNYPNDSLIIAGDGELLDKLRERHIRNVKLLGRVKYDSIYELYAIADVFVIATMQDNWSLVVPEAMSCGIPVATSIYNGCHTDLIKEGITGFTFDPLREESIVESLGKFHSCDIKTMGCAAREMEMEFGVSKSAERIYEALLKYKYN